VNIRRSRPKAKTKPTPQLREHEGESPTSKNDYDILDISYEVRNPLGDAVAPMEKNQIRGIHERYWMSLERWLPDFNNDDDDTGEEVKVREDKAPERKRKLDLI
jgi:hypothetical protein